MPAAVAVVAAAAVKAVAAFSLSNFLISTAISLALNTLASVIFGKKPKAPEGQSMERPRQETIRSNVEPHRLIYGQMKVSGPLVYATVTNGDKNMHMIVALSAHESEEIGAAYLDDRLVGTLDGSGNATASTWKNTVRIKKHLGLADQAADTTLVSEVAQWTNAHRLRGITYAYVRLIYDRDVYPTGLPSPSFIVKGRKLYDPRTETTVWSDNWALCIRDYILSPQGLNADPDEINEESFIEAANISDEDADTTSGVQKRYTLNGIVYTDQKPIDVIEDMLTAGAGALVYTKGQYHLYAGAYRTPEIEFKPDDIIEFKVTPRTPRKELFNRVRGTFVDPEQFWENGDFPPVENPLYEEQDGEQITRDIELVFTTDKTRAQRIGKIHLEKSRQPITVEAVMNYKALDLAVMDTCMLTVPDLGWDQKVFQCLTWDEDPRVGIRLLLKEEAEECYDWNDGNITEFDPAPDTNLPLPNNVAAPTGLTAQSGDAQLYVAGDGTVGTRIKVTWDDGDSTFVLYRIIEYKKDGDANPTRFVIPTASNEHYISPVKDGDVYTINLYNVNIRQIPSQTPASISHVVVGKTAKPPRPDVFLVDRLADGTRRYTWELFSVPVDVRVGGGFRIKYELGTSLDWDTGTLLHSGVLLASPFESNELAAGTYTFGIKTVDSSGNESDDFTQVVIELGDPRLRSALLQRIERDLNWPGTLEDCYVNYNRYLEANSVGDWDDLPDEWDDLPDTWSEILPSVSPITYTSPVIDLLVDLSFNPLLTVDADGTQTLEMKTGSTADGNVTGSFGPLVPVTGVRYIQFKVTIDDTHPLIKNMIAILDGETLVDDFENINTGTETADWFESIGTGHFKIGIRKDVAVITTAQITALQNVGAGFTWELLNKNTTISGWDFPAAEFKVYNASNTLADVVIDAQLKGPKSS